MGYKTVPGERVSSTTRRSGLSPCVRCGLMRNADGGGKGRTGLCKECRSTMTKAEIEAWRVDRDG